MVEEKMNNDTWTFLQEYSRRVFGGQDDHLAGLMTEAVAAGLPDIAVTADVGRMLMMLARLVDARLAIEVGTLAGYSGIWIARGLAPGGRLVTIEIEPAHARFARAQFARAGVADRVDLREGSALDVLPLLAAELGPASVDLVFIDAEKTEYLDYFRMARPLLRPGGVVVADNVLYTSGGWINDLSHPRRRAADELNRMVAADPAFDGVLVPLRSGLLVARRRSNADR